MKLYLFFPQKKNEEALLLSAKDRVNKVLQKYKNDLDYDLKFDNFFSYTKTERPRITCSLSKLFNQFSIFLSSKPKIQE